MDPGGHCPTRIILENASFGMLFLLVLGDTNSAMGVGREGAVALATPPYSRQYEEQCDREGIKLILAAGIDPGPLNRPLEVSVAGQYPMAKPSERGSLPPVRRPFSGWIRMPLALPMVADQFSAIFTW